MDELIKIREERAKAFINEEGLIVNAVSPDPLHWPDRDGNWIDIDTTIDIITKRATKLPYDVAFRNTLSEDDSIRFIIPEAYVQFGLKKFGIKGYEESLISGEVEIEGNKATYPFIWGKVIYEVFSQSLKETIYIEQNIIEDPSVLGLPLDDAKVVFDFNLFPVEFESDVVAKDARGHKVNVHRTATGIEMSYIDYSNAYLPIEIDPTLNALIANSGSLENTVGFVPVTIVTNSNILYFGSETAADDDKGEGGYVVNKRAFFKFPMSYSDHTIYGDCYLYLFGDRGIGSAYVHVINDFGTLDASDWNAAASFITGDFVELGGNRRRTPVGSNLKNSLILKKGSVFAIRIQGNEGAAETSGYYLWDVVNILPDYPFQLIFNSYTTFTQNAPTYISPNVIVTWINGGGLVAGDHHKIYYKQGTGFTADQVIAGGLYVQSSGYSATTVNIPGLTLGLAYCIVVVDVQVISAVSYPGAKSNVQTFTIQGSSFTVNKKSVMKRESIRRRGIKYVGD